MDKKIKLVVFVYVLLFMFSCHNTKKENSEKLTKNSQTISAKAILGNSDYLAISYGGYREQNRDVQPTIPQIKEDMKILSAMGVKVLRTYNVHFAHAENVLKAITALKKENADFEMYVMLGIWIDCKSAFNWQNGEPDHTKESKRNPVEVKTAVELAKQYSDIIKVLAVGNEAMVKWATSYYVEPWIILKWVNHLQDLKKKGELSADLWITSSDDYASWGGGDAGYHTEDLNKIAHAVDYISMHTYPYHNSHYNPKFWKVLESEENLSGKEKVDLAMLRARDFAKRQYDSVSNYMKSIGVNKPIHIGETGWASVSNGHYGKNGSRATDEYKQGLYYKHIREWTDNENISCFYFEAFNEQWKDAKNLEGSENHFGLINLKGEAKYPIWDLVDKGVFKGLTRDGNPITKTYNGKLEELMQDVLVPNTDYPR